MLHDAHIRGAHAALERFKIASPWMDAIKTQLIGQPGRLMREGMHAFKPEGFLSAKNVFWPAVSGPGGSKLNWLMRLNTAMLPLQVRHELREDTGEGALTKTLGAAGGIAGSMYGFPALGMLGAPLLSSAGRRIGKGIGHLVEGNPQDQGPPQHARYQALHQALDG